MAGCALNGGVLKLGSYWSVGAGAPERCLILPEGRMEQLLAESDEDWS
jgi:hypothetical protein